MLTGVREECIQDSIEVLDVSGSELTFCYLYLPAWNCFHPEGKKVPVRPQSRVPALVGSTLRFAVHLRFYVESLRSGAPVPVAE